MSAGRAASRRRIRLILMRELRERLEQRAYRIALVVGAILSAGMVIVPGLFLDDDDGSASADPVVVVVAAAPRALGVEALTDAARTLEAGAGLRFRTAGPGGIRQAVESGRADLGLDLAGSAAQPQARLVVADGADPPAGAVSSVVSRAAALDRLDAQGVADAAQALRPVGVAVSTVTGPGGDDVSAASAALLSLVLYIGGIFLVQGIGSGLVADRAARITEAMLTAVRPVEHLAGKFLGVGAAAILQLGTWFLAAALAFAATGGGPLEGVPLAVLLWFPVAVVLTYVVFGSTSALLVLPVRKTEDVGSATAPTILLQAGAFIAASTIAVPGEAPAEWVRWLSLVPWFSPMLMQARLATGDVAAWEVAVALVGPLLAGALLLRLAAGAYARSAIDPVGGKGLRATLTALRR